MKTILITGSNRGIGFEIARQCAAKSFRVFLSGRNKEKLEEALQKLQQEKLQAEILVMDTSDPESISEVQGLVFAAIKCFLPEEKKFLLKHSLRMPTVRCVCRKLFCPSFLPVEESS